MNRKLNGRGLKPLISKMTCMICGDFALYNDPLGDSKYCSDCAPDWAEKIEVKSD